MENTAPPYLRELRDRLKLEKIAEKCSRKQANLLLARTKKKLRMDRKNVEWFSRLPDE